MFQPEHGPFRAGTEERAALRCAVQPSGISKRVPLRGRASSFWVRLASGVVTPVAFGRQQKESPHHPIEKPVSNFRLGSSQSSPLMEISGVPLEAKDENGIIRQDEIGAGMKYLVCLHACMCVSVHVCVRMSPKPRRGNRWRLR